MQVRIRSLRLIMCMVIVTLLGGCGGGTGEANTTAPYAPTGDTDGVQDAGDGETQSSPELGSQSEPIAMDLVAAHPGGVLAMPHVDLCDQAGVESALKRFNRHGIEARRAELWFKDRPRAEPVLRTLVCSIPMEPIYPRSQPTGGANISVPCPDDQPYADQTTGAVRFRYARGTGFLTAEVSQVAGGYGSGGDGLWGYDFLNNGTEVVRPAIWLLCSATPSPKHDQP